MQGTSAYFTRCAVFFMRLFPISFTLVGLVSVLFFKLDPFYYVFEDILPSKIFQNHQILISTIRCILSIIPLLEFFQIASFLYVAGNVAVDFLLILIRQYTRGKMSVTATFRVHDMGHIVLAFSQKLSDVAIAGLLGLTMISGIITWYLTIVAYNLIPLTIYWVVPFIAVADVSVVQIILIPLTYMSEASHVAIQKFKIVPEQVPNLSSCFGVKFSPRRCLRMRIRAMRKLILYAGMFDYRFLQLDKQTKVSFIENLVAFTISAILAKRN